MMEDNLRWCFRDGLGNTVVS